MTTSRIVPVLILGGTFIGGIILFIFSLLYFNDGNLSGINKNQNLVSNIQRCLFC